jgi:hypothetical protein
MDSEPSAARMAIEPLDAIGPVSTADALGAAPLGVAALGRALVSADGPAVALETGLPDGAGPPHAATANSATQPRSATRLIE